MVPTLSGRLQTRIFLVVVVGGIWTLIITPVVRLFVDTGEMGDVGLGDVYQVTYAVLAIVLVLGIIWELIYHALMQFRWEKDWPTLFGWVTVVNEGIVAYLVAKNVVAVDPTETVGAAEWRYLLNGLTVPPFLVHFLTTWFVINIFANYYMAVLFIRWRFRGGRILGSWTP